MKNIGLCKCSLAWFLWVLNLEKTVGRVPREMACLRRVFAFLSFFIVAHFRPLFEMCRRGFRFTTACCWLCSVHRPFLKIFYSFLPSGWRHVRRVGRRVVTSLCPPFGHVSSPKVWKWVGFTYIYILD